jgi:4-amino-4-deoxy-L-arabinose transferase-like glycosyltransferase
MYAQNPALLTERATRKLPRAVLLMLVLVYAIAGLFGRDPWRPDDALGFGAAWTMAHGVLIDWLLPTVAGAPYAEEGPLFIWLSAISVKLLGSWLGIPVASRIPAGMLIGVAISGLWYATYILGRTTAAQPIQFMFGGAPQPRDYGRAIADGAALTAMATLGMLMRLHESTAEAAQFACLCLLLYGVARAVEAPRFGATLAGGAIAALLLTRGWQASVPSALPVLVLLALHRPLAPARRDFVLIALPMALVPLAVWLTSLWVLHPYGKAYVLAWNEWNLEVLSGQSLDGLVFYLRNLPVFGWPALPFALLASWRWRERLRASHIAIPLTFMMFGLATMLLSNESQEGLMLVPLPGAIVLAAFLLPTLARNMINAIDWFALMSLSVAAILLWLGWVAMQTGFPAVLAQHFGRQAPDFVPEFNPISFVLAALATVFWAWTCRWRITTRPHVVWRAMVISCAGVLTAWLLITTLWLPWINHTKTYRDVAQSMRGAIGTRTLTEDCVSTLRLNLAQRAAFAYFGELHFERLSIATAVAERALERRGRVDEEASGPAGCRWLLVQDSLQRLSDTHRYPAMPDGQWELRWEGRRFSDRDERFRLYHRTDG